MCGAKILVVLSCFYTNCFTMKSIKTSFTILSLGLFFTVFAGPKTNQPVAADTYIKGVFEKEKVTSVVLHEVIEGKRSEMASTKVSANHQFAFALPAHTEGLYYISDQNKRTFIRIYLKQGDQLEINIDEDGAYTLPKASSENKVLYDWYKLAGAVMSKSNLATIGMCTYECFFPKLDSLLPLAKAFPKKIKTTNPKFNRLMNFLVTNDVEAAAMAFLLLPNSKHPKKEEYPTFYSTIIQPQKYCTTQLLQMGDGTEILSRYVTFNSLMFRDTTRSYKGFWALDMFCNDTIKGAYIASNLGRLKTFDEVEAAIAPHKKLLMLPGFQASYFAALKANANFKKGNPSFNFTYPDVTGKNVSMKDLKGKVVLVDMWATWCGPCKAQIPALKQLETELHGKDIEFVSISVDEAKDHEKWKAFITKEQLGGTQLFATGWSEMAKYYEVTGIPRFMVFDKEGKIVSTNSPRPTDPELKELLLNTLEGK